MSMSLSSVRLMAPQGLSLGIWRPVSLIGQADKAAAALSDWQAQWTLKRISALTPTQLWRVYVSLCVLSLLVTGVTWTMGAALVLPFACIELALLGLALQVCIRHAADRDEIAMKADLLRVARHRAGQVELTEFHPRWVRIEPDGLDGSLVRLSGQGHSVVVGEFVQRAHRRQLADEFRWALRHLED